MGVGGPLGFGGNISPAKLAFVHGLADPAHAAEEAGGLLEVRVHGVGGSSPAQILEQADYVQVGGDALAQFIRRWGDRLRVIPWPIEGYWWGGLTSRPAGRALWSLMFPLLLCNLAAWTAPAPPRAGQSRGRALWLAGSCLAVTLRWAGYVLTLVFTASVASASLDTFGWQCDNPASSQNCHVSWLHWMPAGAGPRMTLFVLVPVLVVAVVGYTGRRTASSYERWQIRPTVRTGASAAPKWPLAAPGFWHGLRPVSRLQLLHLAGAAGLLSLYLAWVPASHHGWRVTAIIAALVIIGGSGLLLAWPHAGRPGSNPYPHPNHPPQAPSDDADGFDRAAWTALALSSALLTALALARLWWRPQGPRVNGVPGILPGDAGIWEGLAIAMGVLVAGAFLLTLRLKVVIRSVTRRASQADAGAPAEPGTPLRPFAGGFLGPAALCLGCLTGGILAAGVNLAVPRLLIGSAFRVGPAYPDVVSVKYPVEVAWPLFGFMSALVFMLGALVVLAVCFALPRFLWVAHVDKGKIKGYYPDAAGADKAQVRRIAWQWSGSRAADLMGLLVAVLALAGLAGMISFFGADPTKPFNEKVIGFEQWLVAAGAVALYGYTVAAFRNQGKRTRIQALWDVGTFWPRACQPFAPPCYMERTVPELVNRLDGLLTSPAGGSVDGSADATARQMVARLAPGLDASRLAGELAELRPHYDRILVNGYSQGAPISAAAIAQLPRPRTEKISLVTVGAPLRRLYGRGFPLYFGPDCLEDLRELLGGAERPRWRNAVRNSDYIGGFIFADPYGTKDLAGYPVDKAVLDPVCVAPGDGDGATVPAIHAHSDFWPDPQVALLTRSLLESHRPPLRTRPFSQHDERLERGSLPHPPVGPGDVIEADALAHDRQRVDDAGPQQGQQRLGVPHEVPDDEAESEFPGEGPLRGQRPGGLGVQAGRDDGAAAADQAEGAV